MSDILKLIDMDWKSGALFLAALVIVAVFLIQKFDWIVERFGLISRRQQKEMKQDNSIEELKEHAKKTDDNFEKILENISNIQDCVNNLSEQVNVMQKKNDENEIARMGDRLTQAYNFYKKRGYITRMEKWSFDNMVKQYKVAGGNSWIDDVVVPASRSWEIVDE